MTREIRADGLTTTAHTYEATTSRLKTVTDPKQQMTTYTYNLDDTIASTVYTNAQIATPSVSFMYDPAYNRVTTMVDGTGTTSYTYQPSGALGAGQVASVDGPLADDTITYSYDELGRVVSRAINGVAASQTYDALGRVTTEANVLGTFTYGYEGVTGRLASVAYPNGQTSTHSYLPNLQDHRLETIHHQYPNGATLSRFDYTYDGMGNILTWRQQADTTAVVWEYGYDAADQLTAAVKKGTDPPGTILQRYYYRYDPAGNRLSEQIDDQTTSWTYDALNRLVTQTPGGLLKIKGQLNEAGTVTLNGTPAAVSATHLFEGHALVGAGTTAFTITAADLTGNTTTQQYELDTPGAAKVFTFDANGNLTADGTRTFEWDARNQLVALNAGTLRSEFTYDGQQQRVRIVEKDNGIIQSDTKVIWCQNKVCEERGGDGVTVTRRSFSQGEQLVSATHLFSGDHLDSVTDVTDSTAAALARYAFDPWGRRTLIAGADVTNIGYTRHRQSVSGLSLASYRAYDAELGRWVSEDPLRWAIDPNFYRYAWNSPTTWVDPSGLAPDKCGQKPCTGPVDRQSYYGCVLYELGGTAGLGFAACAAVTSVSGPGGFVCAVGQALLVRLKCIECATVCPGGTRRNDCFVQAPDEPADNGPRPGTPPQGPRGPRGPRR